MVRRQRSRQKTKTSHVAKKKNDSKGPEVKKIIKKNNGVHLESGVTAKESSAKKSIKKKADAMEVAKVAVNVDSIESDPFHSALMKKINEADLNQKVAQTINQSMRRSNAKHMEVHVSGPFQNKKIERVIGLLFLAIMD